LPIFVEFFAKLWSRALTHLLTLVEFFAKLRSRALTHVFTFAEFFAKLRSRALTQDRLGKVSRTSLINGVLKGHDFSRAAKRQQTRGLQPRRDALFRPVRICETSSSLLRWWAIEHAWSWDS
jgi:hypothetical protein